MAKILRKKCRDRVNTHWSKSSMSNERNYVIVVAGARHRRKLEHERDFQQNCVSDKSNAFRILLAVIHPYFQVVHHWRLRKSFQAIHYE